MHENQMALIQYGIELMQRVLGIAKAAWPVGHIAEKVRDAAISDETLQHVQQAREIVGDFSDLTPNSTRKNLLSIFCAVADRAGRQMTDCYGNGRRLSIDLNQSTAELPEKMWEDFSAELSRVPPGAGSFETFLHLLCKYGWHLPGTTSFPDISVYEQFKAVASLSCCMTGQTTKKILLVAGDIPGIQKMLYTLSSTKAARTLRGRSFYLQLLNDAIVAAILRELSLPHACVIHNAGGNFRLLVHLGDEQTLEALRREINRRLLALHGGELFLALAWTAVAISDCSQPAGFAEAVHELSEKLRIEKQRPFASLGVEHYQALFGCSGNGSSQICPICQEELLPGELKADVESCRQCDSYQRLAGKIAKAQERPWFAVQESRLRLWDIDLEQASTAGRPSWDEVLQALGRRYGFGEEVSTDQTVWNSVYLLNDVDRFIPATPKAACGYGFRFLANVTPRIEKRELCWLQKSLNESGQDHETPREGNVRDTNIMALCDATGVRCYGVLRMDVDDLGDVFSERLLACDMLHASALSNHLSLFFEGWLNRLCTTAVAEWQSRLRGKFLSDKTDRRDKTPYVIYSGGDDLFIVGTWDFLPFLARRIRRDFGSYVKLGFVSPEAEVQNPPITISAGIYFDAKKFPLYRAAELAKAALGSAKHYVTYEPKYGEIRPEVTKDAIGFLGIALSWTDFENALELTLELARLLANGTGDGKMPRSLLWLLNDVAELYRQDAEQILPNQIAYGRWMWRLDYGHRRFVDQLRQSHPEWVEDVNRVMGMVLDTGRPVDSVRRPTVQFLGMLVRWTELLVREEGNR